MKYQKHEAEEDAYRIYAWMRKTMTDEEIIRALNDGEFLATDKELTQEIVEELDSLLKRRNADK